MANLALWLGVGGSGGSGSGGDEDEDEDEGSKLEGPWGLYGPSQINTCLQGFGRCLTEYVRVRLRYISTAASHEF